MTWMIAYWTGVAKRPKMRRRLCFIGLGDHSAQEAAKMVKDKKWLDQCLLVKWDWEKVEELEPIPNKHRNQIYEQLMGQWAFE